MKFLTLPVGPGSDIWVDWGDGSTPINYQVNNTETYLAVLYANLIEFSGDGENITDEAFKNLHDIGDVPLHIYDDSFDLETVDIKIWGTVSYWVSLPISLLPVQIGPDTETIMASPVNNVKQYGDLVTEDFSSRKLIDDGSFTGLMGNSEVGEIDMPWRSSFFTGIRNDAIVSAVDYPKINDITDMSYMFVPELSSVFANEAGDGPAWNKFHIDFTQWSNIDFSNVVDTTTKNIEMIPLHTIFPLSNTISVGELLADNWDMSPLQLTGITITDDDPYPAAMFTFDDDIEPNGFVPPTFNILTISDELELTAVNFATLPVLS